MHPFGHHHGHHGERCIRRGEGDGFGGGRGHRVFGQGGLRLVLLQLIADKPSHGYELIKAVEDRLHGTYSPSPGVVYPTLTWLEELGYTTVEDSEGARKRYAITDAGQAYLSEHREAVDELLARFNRHGPGRHERPPEIARAIENFKLALRMRLSQGPLSKTQVHALVDVLDAAAKQVERL
ncbi:PadR family transcriptional regulator [Aquincola sp. MAHUQ-54]|uniref:PadR family transcriptional regulator n=1 Tax=Aquincola agrisoli TaxID=3119538 RepID=A0AAW9QIS8_9BURK